MDCQSRVVVSLNGDDVSLMTVPVFVGVLGPSSTRNVAQYVFISWCILLELVPAFITRSRCTTCYHGSSIVLRYALFDSSVCTAINPLSSTIPAPRRLEPGVRNTVRGGAIGSG